jgi:hypothetical protein
VIGEDFLISHVTLVFDDIISGIAQEGLEIYRARAEMIGTN